MPAVARPRRAAGGADRPERRRQDQPPRGGVVPVARPRPPRRRARRGRARRAGDGSLGGRGDASRTPPATVDLGTGVALGPEGPEARRRSASTTRRSRSSDALLEHLRVLWLTPAMDGLFTGPRGRPPPLSRPRRARHRQARTAPASTPSRRRCAGGTSSSPSRRRTDAPGSTRSRPRWRSSASPSPRRGANGRRSIAALIAAAPALALPVRRDRARRQARAATSTATPAREVEDRYRANSPRRARRATPRPAARSPARTSPTSASATGRSRWRRRPARPASRRRCSSAWSSPRRGSSRNSPARRRSILLDEIAAHLDETRRGGAVRRPRRPRRAGLHDRHRRRRLRAARRRAQSASTVRDGDGRNLRHDRRPRRAAATLKSVFGYDPSGPARRRSSRRCSPARTSSR